MKTGYLMLFQNAHENLSDADMVKKEMDLAVMAEDCGFDTVWSAEHHFDDYSMIPDNLQALTYVAAKTSKIQLGTGAVILPWNEPIRVAEKLSMLDALCDGRLVYGIGRGLARKEYEAFGIDMETARARFEEAAPMIVNALETGFIEGDGLSIHKNAQRFVHVRAAHSRTACMVWRCHPIPHPRLVSWVAP